MILIKIEGTFFVCYVNAFSLNYFPLKNCDNLRHIYHFGGAVVHLVHIMEAFLLHGSLG